MFHFFSDQRPTPEGSAASTPNQESSRRRRGQRPGATHDDRTRDPLTTSEAAAVRTVAELYGWA